VTDFVKEYIARVLPAPIVLFLFFDNGQPARNPCAGTCSARNLFVPLGNQDAIMASKNGRDWLLDAVAF